ncbi:LuxR C-terminal-related transcriptional regulator [Fibrella aquatica]|uniref:LuxR C-terminal-related transcriptional regulator n=1 Tax=Fibrella aquatica TaxID=3242487 RepID=UPI003521660E
MLLRNDRLAGEAISHFLLTKGLQCLGTHTDQNDAYQAAIRTTPDFFITEADLIGTNGYELVRLLKTQLKIDCIICVSSSATYKYETFNINMSGYVSPEGGIQEILECIHTIQLGKRYISSYLSEILMPQTALPLLRRMGDQEINVLRLLACGLENEDIASKLNIKLFTLNTHFKNIKTKLNLSTTRQLAIFAAQNFLKKPITSTIK